MSQVPIPPPGSVLLLRHASAGDRDRFDGDPAERPLDADGRAVAAALPDHLAGFGLRDVVLVSSPTARCRQTLAPLAEALGTTVAVEDGLAELTVPLPSSDGWPDAAWLGTRAVRALDAATARAGGRPVVACSHGEVLPAALAVLIARHDLVVPDTCELTAKALPKGAGWLVVPSGSGPPIRPVPLPPLS